jgi:hypothetical protein
MLRDDASAEPTEVFAVLLNPSAREAIVNHVGDGEVAGRAKTPNATKSKKNRDEPQSD